jgi:hypothetical protein
MRWFGRTGGYYLFWTGFVYFWIGMYLAFTQAARPEIATAIWICVLALPFAVPPIGRYFNLDVEWDHKMFDWFRNYKKSEGSVAEDMNNVVKFPELKAAPEPKPEPEQPAKIFYRFGLTDNNRVAFSMGYSEITMNREGVQGMIDQLTFFRDQLTEEEEQQ